MSDEEKAREYRLEVKKRLFGPYRVSFESSQLQCGEGRMPADLLSDEVIS